MLLKVKKKQQIGEIEAVTLNLKEEINEDPDLIVEYINYRPVGHQKKTQVCLKKHTLQYTKRKFICIFSSPSFSHFDIRHVKILSSIVSFR